MALSIGKFVKIFPEKRIQDVMDVFAYKEVSELEL